METQTRNDDKTILNITEKTLIQDSFEMTYGTPSKGSQVCIKIYYDAFNIGEAQVRIENALKIRAYLMEKGIIQ